MKTTKIFAVLAAAATVLACAPKANEAEEVTPEEEAKAIVENAKPVDIKKLLPSKGLTDSTSYLIGLNFGYFIKMNNFGDDLNYSMIKKGVNDFIRAEGNPQSPEFNDQLKISLDAMNETFDLYLYKMREYQGEKNRIDGEKFLAKNAKKDGVITTDSGLQYKVITEGDGAEIAENDTLKVYYEGHFIDGEQFDACKEEDGVNPFEFQLHSGYRGVIEGWVEGLQYAKGGSEIELYIPGDLAYGTRSYNMPPNQTLVFKVKVVDVKKFVEPEPESEETPKK